MTIINLFSTTIYETYFTENLSNYIDRCMELKDKIKIGGDNWVIKPYNTHKKYNLFKDKYFRKLNNFFTEHVEQYCKELGIKKVKTDDCWFNIYNKGDSQEYHDHNFSVISGIFYLKSNKNDAHTVFKSPINALPSDAKFDKDNVYTWNTYKSYPIQGKLLLFRSNLLHCVEQQKTNSNRITIALNYK